MCESLVGSQAESLFVREGRIVDTDFENGVEVLGRFVIHSQFGRGQADIEHRLGPIGGFNGFAGERFKDLDGGL